MSVRRILAAAVAVLAIVLAASPAAAHEERDAVLPTGAGSVPDYRMSGTTLLVCQTDKAAFDQRIAEFPGQLRTINVSLWNQCQKSGYRTIQAAVDRVDRPGMIIKVLPGEYREEPSLESGSAQCADLPARPADRGYQLLSYEQQVECPHNQNLVAVLGRKDLQLEGMGATPADVVLDAQYRKLTALRIDRSSGIFVRNLTVQRTAGAAISLMEVNGFALDTVVGRWNDAHGLLAYAVDHGLITDCETYGNGDAGVAVESARSAAAGSHSVEVRRCRSHDNLQGFAGPAANSVWIHDSTFSANTVGLATGSTEPGHPGQPQSGGTFQRNTIAGNNQDYYRFVRDGTCDRPSATRGYENGVVCPLRGVPVGTGVLNQGGNDNVWSDNWVYDNAYAGFVSTWSPGVLRRERGLGAQLSTSHGNRFFGNTLGATADGAPAPNGMDFWWDGQGSGSCWQRTDRAQPSVLPRCNVDGERSGFGSHRYLAEPLPTLKLFACVEYDATTGRIPTDCDWYGATGWQRIEVKWAVGSAVALGLLLMLLWGRLLRGRGMGLGRLGLMLALVGLGVSAYGTLRETTWWSALGLGVLGLGLLAFGLPLRRRGRPHLSGLTVTMAAVSLLAAVDHGLWLLPWIPIPPLTLLVALQVIWAPWALGAILQGRVMARAPRPRPDPLLRYTHALRG